MDVSHIPVLVPEGLEAADLSLGELDKATFHLKCDPLEALRYGDKLKRYAAYAYLCWLWAKRQNPKAQLDTYREYTIDEATHALRMDEEAEEDEEPDPTESSDESSESSSLELSDASPTTSTE